MTDTNHTAAQPLDLDKLEALAKAARDDIIRSHGWAGTVDGFDALRVDEQYLLAANPATILALIAQARTARPAETDALFADGTTFQLTGWAGGAAPGGEFSTVTCERHTPDGAVEVIDYVRTARLDTTASASDDDLIIEAVKRDNVYGVLPNSASTMSIGRAVLAAERARATLAPVAAQQAAAKAPKCERCLDEGMVYDGNYRSPCIACQDLTDYDEDDAAAKAPAAQAVDARIPTEAMLKAARDWSVKKYGKGIGNDAAIGCWQAMYDASPASTPEASQQAAENLAGRKLSVDVSTGDDDAGNRIFAELTGETGSDGKTLIAIETSRNFASQQAAAETPVARLHEEISDRPYTEGKQYFEITILDRARCFDGMGLYAAPIAQQAAAVAAPTVCLACSGENCPGCKAAPATAVAATTSEDARECNGAALEVLADIFGNTERPDKIAVSMDHAGHHLTVRYEDLDEEWFHEIDAAMRTTQQEGGK